MKKNKSSKTTFQEKEIIANILIYLLIGMAWFIIDEDLRRNERIRYHFLQSVVLYFTIGTLTPLSLIFSAINIFLGGIISIAISIATIALIIQGIIHASRKEKKPLFLIGTFAEEIKVF